MTDEDLKISGDYVLPSPLPADALVANAFEETPPACVAAGWSFPIACPGGHQIFVPWVRRDAGNIVHGPCDCGYTLRVETRLRDVRVTCIGPAGEPANLRATVNQ